MGKAPWQLLLGYTAMLPPLSTPQQAGRGATAGGEAATEQRGRKDMTLVGSFPSPARSTCSASLFYFFTFFFNVCFNFIVFPTMWKGAAAKNNVAKPRGLAHIAWSLQQEQRL